LGFRQSKRGELFWSKHLSFVKNAMKSKENHGLKETNMDEGTTILGNSLLNTNLGLLKVMFDIFLGNQPYGISLSFF